MSDFTASQAKAESAFSFFLFGDQNVQRARFLLNFPIITGVRFDCIRQWNTK